MKKEKVLSDTILKMLDCGRVKPPNWNKIRKPKNEKKYKGE